MLKTKYEVSLRPFTDFSYFPHKVQLPNFLLRYLTVERVRLSMVKWTQPQNPWEGPIGAFLWVGGWVGGGGGGGGGGL